MLVFAATKTRRLRTGPRGWSCWTTSSSRWLLLIALAALAFACTCHAKAQTVVTPASQQGSIDRVGVHLFSDLKRPALPALRRFLQGLSCSTQLPLELVQVDGAATAKGQGVEKVIWVTIQGGTRPFESLARLSSAYEEQGVELAMVIFLTPPTTSPLRLADARLTGPVLQLHLKNLGQGNYSLVEDDELSRVARDKLREWLGPCADGEGEVEGGARGQSGRRKRGWVYWSMMAGATAGLSATLIMFGPVGGAAVGFGYVLNRMLANQGGDDGEGGGMQEKAHQL